MKTCPECAEEVRAAAIKCRFCGYRWDGASPVVPAAPVRVARPIPVPGSVAIVFASLLYVATALILLPAAERLRENQDSQLAISLLAVALVSYGVAVPLRLAGTLLVRRSSHRLVERVFFSPWTPGIAFVVALGTFVDQLQRAGEI